MRHRPPRCRRLSIVGGLSSRSEKGCGGGVGPHPPRLRSFGATAGVLSRNGRGEGCEAYENASALARCLATPTLTLPPSLHSGARQRGPDGGGNASCSRRWAPDRVEPRLCRLLAGGDEESGADVRSYHGCTTPCARPPPQREAPSSPEGTKVARPSATRRNACG